MEIPRCSLCAAPAVHYARYEGTHRCRGHFLESVRRRVREELRHQAPLGPASRVAVGVSGGKDSVTCLRLIHEAVSGRRVQLLAVTVDEGIEGYRPEGLAIAKRHAEELGVPHRVVSYRETVGRTMDEIVPLRGERTPCAFCGVFRRDALNRAARDWGATHVATGHNLDDVAQTVLMNLLGGELERIGRMAPHGEPASPDLVPRLLPLRTIPEQEVALTALLEGWEVHDAECPHAAPASRNRFRDLVARLEEDVPGTRHRLLAVGDSVRELLALRGDADRGAPPRPCAVCGEPAVGALCKKCGLLEMLPGAGTFQSALRGGGRRYP